MQSKLKRLWQFLLQARFSYIDIWIWIIATMLLDDGHYLAVCVVLGIGLAAQFIRTTAPHSPTA